MRNPQLNLLAGIITILVFAAVAYTSCKKDICHNVACLNGGYCKGGNCICPSGYTGSLCQTGPCEGVHCKNGGSCENGACSCPPGFSGALCELGPNQKFFGQYRN